MAFLAGPPELPPGAVTDEVDQLPIPHDLPAGEYRLSLAVVQSPQCRPVVQLGITGREDDGWYPLSTVVVE